MNRSIVYIATISMIVLLTACSFIAKADQGVVSRAEMTYPYYEVEMKTEIEEFDEYHMTVHYPQTPNSQIDQAIIDYINQKKALFKKKSYQVFKTDSITESFELHIDFDVVHQGGRFFVVRFKETMDLGKEEPIVSQTVFNFSKGKGNRVTTEQFFDEKTDYLKELSELAEKKSEKRLKHEVLTHALRPLSSNFEKLAWTEDGFALYLDEGMKKIVLDQKRIKKLLRDEYAPLWLKTEQQKSEKKTEVNAVAAKQTHSSNSASNEGDKEVILTFDDGPHPKYTQDILDILKEHDARATFFMIGKRVQYYPEVAQAIVNQGHAVGNHTWDHSQLSRLSSRQVEKQISSTQSIIKEATGEEPKLIRIPFGETPYFSFNPEFLKPLDWTIEVKQWKGKTPEQIANEVIARTKDGSVILLHDLHPSMVQATELIVERLDEQGYTFVTPSE